VKFVDGKYRRIIKKILIRMRIQAKIKEENKVNLIASKKGGK